MSSQSVLSAVTITPESSRAAVVEEAKRLEEAVAAAASVDDWHALLDTSTDLFLFQAENADVLGIDETTAKVERLASDMVALVNSVLETNGTIEPDERAELERTKIAIDAKVRAYKAELASRPLPAAAAAMALAVRAEDIESARAAAPALASAYGAYLASTEGSTDGWPDDLRIAIEEQRADAKVILSSTSDLLSISLEHPSQLKAYTKLVEVRYEIVECRRQLDTIRRNLHSGSRRKLPIRLAALGFSVAALKGYERVERMYARSAARPPKSALMFAQARAHREAALESFDRAEGHRQASRALLDAPSGAPWVAVIVQALLGWVVLGTLVAANYFVFASFGAGYVSWYITNGAVISLVFGFVSLAVRLDDYPDLISSNPFRYLTACLTLSMHLLLAWNQVVAVDPEKAAGLMLSKVFDLIVSLFAWICVSLAFIGWLLIVAPIQYFPYAVLGAPARNALRNPTRPSYDPETDTTVASPRGSTTGGHVIGYMEKPVALTSAFTAAALWVLAKSL